MKHNIKSIDFSLTPAIQDYLEKKLAHLDKFLPKNIDADGAMCYVELGKVTDHHKKGDIFKTILNIHIGKNMFRAEAQMDDEYASIDVAVAQMEQELSGFKDKRKSLIRRGGQAIKRMIKGWGNDEI